MAAHKLIYNYCRLIRTQVAALTGNVFRNYKVASTDKKYTLELTDFRLFNINDMEDANGNLLNVRRCGQALSIT